MYKIAVIGPESTGKSALTKALARHYSCPFVDEYARDYIANLNRSYTFEDVCEIAKIQIEAENYFQEFSNPTQYPHVPDSLSKILFFPPYPQTDELNRISGLIPGENELVHHTQTNQKPSGFVFFDTELIITKVWFEYCYGQVPDFVTNQLRKGFFDLYLLCDTDLPWVPDPVREHGDDREFFSDWYRREIEQLEKPYVIVQGSGNQRLLNAVEIISQLVD